MHLLGQWLNMPAKFVRLVKLEKKLHWITFEDTNIFIQIYLNINLLMFK